MVSLLCLFWFLLLHIFHWRQIVYLFSYLFSLRIDLFFSNFAVFHISHVKFPFLHSFLTTFLSRTLENNQQKHNVQFPEDCWMKWGVFRCSVCTDYVEGRCPVNFTSVPTPSSGVDIEIHVWLKAEGTQSSRTVRKRAFRKYQLKYFCHFSLSQTSWKIRRLRLRVITIIPKSWFTPLPRKDKQGFGFAPATKQARTLRRWFRGGEEMLSVILCSFPIRVKGGRTRKSHTSNVPDLQQPGEKPQRNHILTW